MLISFPNADYQENTKFFRVVYISGNFIPHSQAILALIFKVMRFPLISIEVKLSNYYKFGQEPKLNYSKYASKMKSFEKCFLSIFLKNHS